MATDHIAYLWAKTCRFSDTCESTCCEARWHPLVLHLLDVAACAETILVQEPETTLRRMAAILGMEWKEAKPWLMLLIACHDMGKACPGFQTKRKDAKEILAGAGFMMPSLPDKDVHHAFITQIALEQLLKNKGWPDELSDLCADAVSCHHGTRAMPTMLNNLSGNRYGVDPQNWEQWWGKLFEAVYDVLKPGKPPTKCALSGPDFMLLAGLTSFADWIGSNREWFPFGTVSDCDDLSGWLCKRKKNAGMALEAIGWHERKPLITSKISFAEAFPSCTPPRPLQAAVEKVVEQVDDPFVILIEAPMGEGKTEAALYAHLELQRRFGHRGLYIAMPTKATGNAMFDRTHNFLKSYTADRTLDLQLLHDATQLNEEFQKLRFSGISSEDADDEIKAGTWFTNKKRALLSEYGVGTVDQALLTILPVRHYFVRLWGLANRVVVFDEIHAYDAYTGTLLFHLVGWLRALGASVILLSATLPPEFRRRLASTLGANLPDSEVDYPRLTMFADNACRQVHFDADPGRRCELEVVALAPELIAIHQCISDRLPGEGHAGIIVNTVQRAQDLYALWGKGEAIKVDGIIIGKRVEDGSEIHLLHARYPGRERQKREDVICRIYGKNEVDRKPAARQGRRILIATQVAEQSLDLDFDLLVTDLAPIDLVLQRAGRIWRHERGPRPVMNPALCIAGLAGEKPGSFGKPLWWNKVYEREDILLRTWNALRKREQVFLPGEIDSLVREVYEGVDLPSDEDVIRRIEQTEVNSVGRRFAQQTAAHQAIIGLPDDGSWKDTSRFYLYDDDEPGVHRTLIAKTRIGDESVTAVPLFPKDEFNSRVQPGFAQAKEWALRAVALTRYDVVRLMREQDIPEGWRKTPLLRNCYAMVFNEHSQWTENAGVRLDEELGIVYDSKEAT